MTSIDAINAIESRSRPDAVDAAPAQSPPSMREPQYLFADGEFLADVATVQPSPRRAAPAYPPPDPRFEDMVMRYGESSTTSPTASALSWYDEYSGPILMPRRMVLYGLGMAHNSQSYWPWNCHGGEITIGFSEVARTDTADIVRIDSPMTHVEIIEHARLLEAWVYAPWPNRVQALPCWADGTPTGEEAFSLMMNLNVVQNYDGSRCQVPAGTVVPLPAKPNIAGYYANHPVVTAIKLESYVDLHGVTIFYTECRRRTRAGLVASEETDWVY